jgi:hypothetical protein
MKKKRAINTWPALDLLHKFGMYSYLNVPAQQITLPFYLTRLRRDVPTVFAHNRAPVQHGVNSHYR